MNYTVNALLKIRCSGTENAITRDLENDTIAYFWSVGLILRQGWKIFLKAERDDLLCCDSNNTTSAWAKTGLFPFNPFCETWEAIIETMGPLKKHYTKVRGGEKTAEYEIKLLENSVPLSEGEKKTLTDGCVQDDYVQAAYFHMRSVLSSWKRRLLFKKHVKPEPQSAQQIIATRIFRFVERSAELKTLKKSMTKK